MSLAESEYFCPLYAYLMLYFAPLPHVAPLSVKTFRYPFVDKSETRIMLSWSISCPSGEKTNENAPLLTLTRVSFLPSSFRSSANASAPLSYAGCMSPDCSGIDVSAGSLLLSNSLYHDARCFSYSSNAGNLLFFGCSTCTVCGCATGAELYIC